MDRGIGAFVVENTPLASLALDEPPDEKMAAALRGAYSIDRNRTVQQDCAFGIRQLVDMALRALSPGIHDTTTAVMCVDYLAAILARLAPREIPSTRHYEDGELRVISIGQDFARLVAESLQRDDRRSGAGWKEKSMDERQRRREQPAPPAHPRAEMSTAIGGQA